MLVDVKDEVLAGEPLYNIKDAAGEITDSNVKIELGTEVLEEGTPLNKALLDKVTQKLIAYNVLANYEDETDEITGYANGLPVTFTTGIPSYISTILFENGNIFVAYRNVSDSKAYFVIIDSNGNIIKNETEIELSYSNYLMARLLKNGNVFIAAENGYFIIYDQNGNVVKEESRYYNASTTYLSVAVMESGNVLITFTGASNYGYWAIYDQEGNELKTASTFKTGTTQHISATPLPNGNAFVAYLDNVSTSNRRGKFVIFSENELVKAETIFDSSDTQLINTITTKNGNVFIVYSDNSSSKFGYFMVYDQDGNLVKEKTAFSAATTNYLSASVLENNNVVISYAKGSTGSYTIYNELGETTQSETAFRDGNTGYNSVAETKNKDLLFTFYNSLNNRGDFVIASSLKTYNRNFQIQGIGEPVLGEKLNIWNKSLDKEKKYLDFQVTTGMCVTLANGNILQIYYDSTDSKPKYLILDTDGNVIKEPYAYTSVNTSTMYACRLANDYVAIAYQNANSGARIQLLTPDGMSLYGSGFGVATATAIRSEGVKIVGLPNGNIFIVYADTAGRTYYKITNTSGTEVKEKTSVSSTSYFWVDNLSDGKVVVGWSYDVASGTDSTKFRIYQQDGTTYSSEISVASTYNYKSGMVALNNDNFIIFIDNMYYFYNGVNLQKSGTYTESNSTRPIAVETAEGDVIVLYFARRNSKYDGYYTVIDKAGNITKKDIIWGETDTTILATPTNDGGVFVGYSPLTDDRMIALFLSRTNFVNTSKNSINGKPIDTILLEGFYQAIYDGEQYIAKEVGV